MRKTGHFLFPLPQNYAYIFVYVFLPVPSTWPKSNSNEEWLDQLLEPKTGVFEADFEEENGTTVTVRDGKSALLNCRVYLLHDKTVSVLQCRIMNLISG